MENNRIERAFFFLLKSGLWGENIWEADLFPLSAEEWSAVYARAVEQTVEGLLYDGLLLLAPENLPPRQMRQKWSVSVDRIERSNRLSNDIIAEQHIFFMTHGLCPILLKGQGVAVAYGAPQHRVCGDIDWYFDKRRHFDLAQLQLTKKGVPTLGRGSPVYLWKGYETDLHDRLFDFHNPFSKNLLKQIRADFPDTTLTIGGREIAVLAPQIQVVQITAHILKHSLSFGIGLRQFCDLAALYDKYGAKLDGKRLELLYSDLGVINWISAVHQLLVDYIGLPADKLPFASNTMDSGLSIIDEVWHGGNFGFTDTSYIKETEGPYIVRKNKTGMLLRRLTKYFSHAPKEALWFPFIHLLNKRKR